VTITAGSGVDLIARTFAQGIAGRLGQPIVVDNRGSIIGAEIVSKAAPDGYTLLVDSSSLWLAPLLQKVPYDPIRDFTPISLLVAAPLILVASPAVPVNSVKDLVALAKAQPGELNYASGSTGGSGHLTAELFKSMAGLNIVRIAYKGSILALPDMMSGRVHMMFESATSILPLVKAGKLKGLAVTSLRPTALVPGMSTVSEVVPGFEVVNMNSMLGPPNMPAGIVMRLNEEVVRFVKTPEAKEKLSASGQEAVGSSPEALATTIKSETAKWNKVIKEAGIRAN
jgi:tripartite-type tricarboxylate transporter receptor subunit TctC